MSQANINPTGAPGPYRPDPQQQAQAARAMPLPAPRPDLQVSPQLYLGKTVYMVKDPVSLAYFRIQPAEHAILRLLDGKLTANDLAERVNASHPAHTIAPDDVLMFVKMLQGAGLLLGRGEKHGHWLRQIHLTRQKKKRVALISNLLFIKVPVLDPDRLLTAIHAYVKPFMNSALARLSILFMIVSAFAALANLNRMAELAHPVLSPTNLLLISVVFLVVKVIHEFGHGLAAKHHGLEVHEMGVMLMVFLPMFYVDTSDAWMLRRKSDRLWITAGGVFIEFLLAAVAVWVWLATDTGIVNLIAFDIMFAASISTLLFNVNPLLRYDGYYFLMDVMEIPNLRAKATIYVNTLLKRYVLGMKTERLNPELRRWPIFTPVYAVMAIIYRWWITFGIILLVWHLLDPFGLEAVGMLLAMLMVTTSIVWPLIKGLKFIWIQQAKTGRRIAATLGMISALSLLGAAILLFEIEEAVEHPIVAISSEYRPVFIAIEGKVEQVFIQPGNYYQQGDPILRMEDSFRISESIQQMEIQARVSQLAMALARREHRPQNVQQEVVRLARLNTEIADRKLKLEGLTIRAPITGRLNTAVRLNSLMGSILQREYALGMMIGPGDMTFAMIVPQADATRIKSTMPIRAKLWSAPQRTYTGTVAEIDQAFLSSLPHESLASSFGGEVELQYTRDESKLLHPSIKAVLHLNPEQNAVMPIHGMTGRAKVILGQSSIGSQSWHVIRQFVSLDWWL